MFVDGKIDTFKSLLTHILYDWGFGMKTPYLNKDSDNDFWINKTYIYKKEDKYYLDYKTESYEVSPKAFEKFSKFYDLQKEDLEFQGLINAFENGWGESEIVKTDTSFSLGEKFLLEQKSDGVFLTTPYETTQVSAKTFSKMNRFFQLIYFQD
jgi:hypothetical protein